MRLSLGKKIVIMIVLVAVLLIVACIAVSGIVVQNMMNKEYILTADSMAATVASIVDGDRMEEIADKVMDMYRASSVRLDNTKQSAPSFDAYTEQFLPLMQDEAYIDIQNSLRSIQDVNEVDCVYTLGVSPEDLTLVYIVDAAYDEEFVTPGRFDFVEESCYPYLDDLTQGFPAFITNTREYGWMVTSCAPIYNSSGEVVCFAAVDLSMNDINGKIHEFLLVLSGILIFLTVIICIFSILYVKHKIVDPINTLSVAAEHYGENQVNRGHEFSTLKIHTGDELEILLGSMVKMERDIDSYIENLTHTREQLSTARQQADDMNELAHKDSLTGIRNRLAYDKEVIRIDCELQDGKHEFGIAMVDLNFLKVINDTHGHKYGNIAIITLCQMICEIFRHSPVFRIGGDEFAVILKNHDYNNIDALVKKFNRQIELLREDESLQPWEQVSAAIGYAVFDPYSDHCVEDVFKRADFNMYERKKEMKAQRK